MSANNKIIIKKKNNKWVIIHWDLDCGKMNDKFPKFDSLEEAVKEANKFMEIQEVEYGLSIKL